MLELVQLEQMYLDLFFNKYNINPAAGSRLGAKHTEETKELFSQINKENPPFLNKTFPPPLIPPLGGDAKGGRGYGIVMKFWRVCVSVCLVL